MLAVPSTDHITIIPFIKLGVLIVITVLVVPLAFSMALTLCKRDAAAEEKGHYCG